MEATLLAQASHVEASLSAECRFRGLGASIVVAIGSVVVAHGLSSSIACGNKSVSPALADRCLTTRPPGKSCSLPLRPMEGHQLLTCKPGSNFHHPWVQHNDPCLGEKKKEDGQLCWLAVLSLLVARPGEVVTRLSNLDLYLQ